MKSHTKASPLLAFHEHQIQLEKVTDSRLLEFKVKVDEVLQAARGKSSESKNDIR